MPLDALPDPGQPVPDAAAPAAEAASAPVPPAPPVLPSPLADVAAGSIPAVLVPAVPAHGQPDPVQTFVGDNFDLILKSGIDYHETKDKAVVLFNPKSISPEKIAEADAAGTLSKLAQPVKEFAAAAAPAPAADETPAPMAAPGALAAAPAPAPVVATGGKTPPGVNAARRQVLAPKQVSPIQPNPVVNQLGRRAV